VVPNPGFGDTWVHQGHVYETLRSMAPSATEEADQIILEALYAAVPELSASNTEVLLERPRSEKAFEIILSTTEDTLRRLCAQHDNRKFLHVSRLCSGVPKLMGEDKNHEDRRVRTPQRLALTLASFSTLSAKGIVARPTAPA
jgi:hypothetical protein